MIPRRFLITGSAGFLGRAAAHRLATRTATERLVALDLRPTPADRPQIESVEEDVRFFPVGLLDGIDAVVHLAFAIRPTRRPDHDRSVNVDATARLLAACGAAGIERFVYLSSTTVYGAHPDYRRPYRETDRVRPVPGFEYAEHKVEVERLIARHATAHPGFRPVVLRGCVVMGPGADNFITESLGMAVLPSPAGSEPPMQYLHIEDFADVLVRVVESDITGTFNVAGSETITWREMVAIAGGRVVPIPARLLAGVIDLSWALHLQTRSRSPGLAYIRYPWLASTDLIGQELGWEPSLTSRRAVEAWAEAR